jgi:hypothetical protein
MAASNAPATLPNDAQSTGASPSQPNERPRLGERERKFVIKVSLPIPT